MITSRDVLMAISVSALSLFSGISSPINCFCLYFKIHIMLLSISMLSRNTVLVLLPTSVVLASLSSHGSYVNGLHLENMNTHFFHIPQHIAEGLTVNTMLSSLFGRKAMTNLDSILKSRDITLLTKVQLVKAIIFPVAIYG